MPSSVGDCTLYLSVLYCINGGRYVMCPADCENDYGLLNCESRGILFNSSTICRAIAQNNARFFP